MHMAAYLPLGVVGVLLFCVAPPLASLVLLWRRRDRLDDFHTQQVYGFLYGDFRYEDCGTLASQLQHRRREPLWPCVPIGSYCNRGAKIRCCHVPCPTTAPLPL